ncbi:integral membrane protein [Glarea lozoyensis ATCC 20868]|uniref:Integral membrane protein n=1 Tax=Glarea lozoyensis (strain ATCC 20868 / MF5171) TaxID=1116229 RepID=S3DHW4_GLAL2|nr:uncharacterized protein GLAREA_02075 [Glarea lozoyensis ATCC 20868]EPE26163.1 integral membrane protein [Glarea lozoyensis ATCC 20868]
MRITTVTGWDDHTFMIAAVFSTATLALMFPLASLGFGKHAWTIDPSSIIHIRQLFYAGQINYVFVQILSKVSLLLFFLRIFFLQKWTRIGCYLTLTFLGTKWIIFLMIVIFQCTPVRSTWDFSVPSHCVNVKVLTILAGGFSILEDLIILSLPIPCIKSLNIGAGKKITATIMFSIGSLATIISIVRLRYLMTFGSYVDTTWDDVDAFVWSVIENSLALVCACLPALRPLLCLLAPKVFGVFSRSAKPATPDACSSSPLRSWKNRKTHSQIADDEQSAIYFVPQETISSGVTDSRGQNTMGRDLEDGQGIDLIVVKLDGKNDISNNLK